MELVTVTDEGPIRIVALNNPSKGNAISKPMAEQLQLVMKEFEQRDDLRWIGDRFRHINYTDRAAEIIAQVAGL